MAETTRVISNLNDTLPAAPTGYDNIKWQINRGVTPPNISANVPRADVAGTKYGTIIYDGSDSPTRYLGADGEWHNMPAGSLPSGGTTGQVLAKASNTDGDAGWINSSTGLLTLIERIELASDAASITFSSLIPSPPSFEDLVIRWVTRGTAALTSTYLHIQFNADTGANYDFERVHWFSTGADIAQAVGQTSAYVANIPAASATALHIGSGEITCPGYARSLFYKNASALFAASLGTGTFTQGRGIYGITWRDTDPISSITIFPSSGNLLAGSVFSVYGI